MMGGGLVARTVAPIKPTLRLLRLASGHSAEELARAAGTTPKAIYEYERGIREPSTTKAVAHARALGISIDDYNRLWREAREAHVTAQATAQEAVR
jgi:transcriptional regulator with XRE-family HTH domain